MCVYGRVRVYVCVYALTLLCKVSLHADLLRRAWWLWIPDLALAFPSRYLGQLTSPLCVSVFATGNWVHDSVNNGLKQLCGLLEISYL